MPRNEERQAAVTWLMPLGTLIQFMLPRWVTVKIARLAGVLAYHLDQRGRERFMDNYRHMLGVDTPEAELKAAARRLFIYLVTNYLDLLSVPVLKRRVTALADLDSRPIDSALGEGRGAVLVTCHLGNWDLAGTVVAARGYPISAVFEPVPGGWARTFNRYRGATRMETISTTDHEGMRRAIERGRMLTLVADRDLSGRGTLCRTFDAWRSFPNGPAVYSLRYNSPLLFGYFVFQDKPGRPPYRAHVEKLEFTPTGSMEADVPALTRLVADRINRMIAQFPDQWLVFSAGWRQRP